MNNSQFPLNFGLPLGFTLRDGQNAADVFESMDENRRDVLLKRVQNASSQEEVAALLEQLCR